MAKKQFKTESKRLLDLMINSIYTNREIFLRELVSNASDALDKRHYLSITDENNRIANGELKIDIKIDEANRLFILSDSGIGMDKQDLENNLGTIAKSGSLAFKEGLEENTSDVDIIGQFGVGFYSAFMIAKKISVESKKANEQAYKWVSTGDDGYTITESDKTDIGTTITLTLKDNTETENFDEFLQQHHIRTLITKYSDYVRYPINMDVEKSESIEGSDEVQTKIVNETLNSMIPLWKRNKADITQQEYDDFYQSKFNDYTNPIKTIHYSLEGNISYNALLYIPSKAPYNYFNADYDQGLKLYCKGVFIMDNAKDLIPSYFRFTKGLVDSDDLSLNISREILQQDRQLKQIAKSIEKKIKAALLDLLNNDRDKYEQFYDAFGAQLKYGLYEDFGAHTEILKDLVMFKSSFEQKYVTLADYVSRMSDEQEFIYYASGESIAKINLLPQIEKVKDKGYEVLYFTENVDEFSIMAMQQFADKKFKSIAQGELDVDSDEEKVVKEKIVEENKSLLEKMSDSIKDTVSSVKISSRLKTHPVCLVSDEGISLEMEKVLAQTPKEIQLKQQGY